MKTVKIKKNENKTVKDTHHIRYTHNSKGTFTYYFTFLTNYYYISSFNFKPFLYFRNFQPWNRIYNHKCPLVRPSVCLSVLPFVLKTPFILHPSSTSLFSSANFRTLETEVEVSVTDEWWFYSHLSWKRW